MDENEIRLRAHQVVWVTWFWHRRTQGICDRWGIRLITVEKRAAGLRGRLGQILRSLKVLLSVQAKVLIVQNPSLGLTLLSICCRPLVGYRLVVDAHNEAVHPYNRPGRWSVRLARWMLRTVDLNVVTNPFLKQDVVEWGGRATTLPDPLPTVQHAAGNGDRTDPPVAMVIATHAPDEPTEAVLGAAGNLNGQVAFVMSGNPKSALARFPDLPRKVRLTGFLPEHEYWQQIAAADVIVDLTLMPDCLVCGAYEAVAFAKPLVLSDNRAARQLFGDCAVFCENSQESISVAVKYAVDNAAQLASRCAEFRVRYDQAWKQEAATVLREIVGLIKTPEPA